MHFLKENRFLAKRLLPAFNESKEDNCLETYSSNI
jgi:hypothetical protein